MKLPKFLLATAALIAIAAATSTVAASPNAVQHEMTVSLADGGTARILYTGNVPPKVTVTDRPDAIGWEPSFFGPESAFAQLDRISAQMDRVWENFDRQMATFVANPGFGPNDDNLATLAASGKLPPGVKGYSFVSTFTSNGACTKFTKVTSKPDAQPQVVSQVSGECGGDSKSRNSAVQVKDRTSHSTVDRRQI